MSDLDFLMLFGTAMMSTFRIFELKNAYVAEKKLWPFEIYPKKGGFWSFQMPLKATKFFSRGPNRLKNYNSVEQTLNFIIVCSFILTFLQNFTKNRVDRLKK